MHGPAEIRMRIPICAGPNGRGDFRMSAATVRITSITTASRLRAAVSLDTVGMLEIATRYFLNKPRSIAAAIA